LQLQQEEQLLQQHEAELLRHSQEVLHDANEQQGSFVRPHEPLPQVQQPQPEPLAHQEAEVATETNEPVPTLIYFTGGVDFQVKAYPIDLKSTARDVHELICQDIQLSEDKRALYGLHVVKQGVGM
jgi:hypothetical protein